VCTLLTFTATFVDNIFCVIVTPGHGVTVNIGLDLCTVYLETVLNYEAIWYTSGS